MKPGWARLARETALATLAALLIALPLVGIRTVADVRGVDQVQWHLAEALCAALLVGAGRLGLALAADWRRAPAALALGVAALAAGWFAPWPTAALGVAAMAGGALVTLRAVAHLLPLRPSLIRPVPGLAGRGLLVLFTLLTLLPFLPGIDRRVLDVAILVLTYAMLGLGLNVTVGLAGLLDLGYAAFFAIGGYTYALLARDLDVGFWGGLPLAAITAALAAVAIGYLGAFTAGAATALAGLLLAGADPAWLPGVSLGAGVLAAVVAALAGMERGMPVLRLRGDYFAVVTLGFGQIVQIVLVNWRSFSGGSQGLTGIPRPSLFGFASFERESSDGRPTVAELLGLDYSTTQRIVFLYWLALALAGLIAWIAARARTLPIGRAWEAVREDEIAARAMGITPQRVKLAAYALGAGCAGLAGAFFATRQGFITPESFSFIESATMVAIVVLGGMGSQLGVALAAIVLVGLPAALGELAQYRMLLFGLGMVGIMLWRPQGLIGGRQPTVKLATARLAPA